MEAKTIALLMLVAAVGIIATNYLAVFNENTVTVTEASPAIEINNIQYKYEYFPFIHEGVIDVPKALNAHCDSTFEYYQLIGRWGGHKLVVNYKLEKLHGVSEGACFGSANQMLLTGVCVEATEAYYDGQFIEVSGKRCVGDATDYTWVNANGILSKFFINGGFAPGSDDAAYTIKAAVYVPASQFKPHVCGDGNCDLDESCSSCEQDCNKCVVLKCGNGMCDSDENFQVCPSDCQPVAPFCGDGFCNNAETCLTCTQDCGQCSTTNCGDKTCNGNETCVTCSGDCGACPPVCGNGVCDSGESTTQCPIDCNKITTPTITEGTEAPPTVQKPIQQGTDYTWYVVGALIILAFLILVIRRK